MHEVPRLDPQNPNGKPSMEESPCNPIETERGVGVASWPDLVGKVPGQ